MKMKIDAGKKFSCCYRALPSCYSEEGVEERDVQLVNFIGSYRV